MSFHPSCVVVISLCLAITSEGSEEIKGVYDFGYSILMHVACELCGVIIGTLLYTSIYKCMRIRSVQLELNIRSALLQSSVRPPFGWASDLLQHSII